MKLYTATYEVTLKRKGKTTSYQASGFHCPLHDMGEKNLVKNITGMQSTKSRMWETIEQISQVLQQVNYTWKKKKNRRRVWPLLDPD